ncbi:MAG: Serine/threonine-protein kinase PknD [Planctomycetes bacterium]|nr:Serine/threonine-protein kinase PknD [Planctomycetota bacterium]
MEHVDKSLIAAVLAVRHGALHADQAASILATSSDSAEALQRVESALGADEFGAGTAVISPSLVDIVADRLQADAGLSDLGLDETTVRTLSEIRRLKADHPAVRDTLLSISPTRMVKDLDLEEMPLIDAADSASPTARPQQSSRKKPSSQLLRAIARAERYTIQKEHARGGMGRILLAHDNVIGREVALKELLPSRMPTGSVPADTESSRGLTERFLREAKVTGQLEHPNIVSVYEIGKNDDDSLYYTMKFVRGKTLSVKLKEIANNAALDKKGKLAARLKLLDNFVDVCNAIAYAHSKGVVHRDLKPENVMLGEYGETIVLDWGLARVKGQEDAVAEKLIQTTRYMSSSVVEGQTDKLTLDGSIVGTPAYMAPEQARGELDEIDEQSDVYSLGAVLYEILTGRPPFDGPTAGLIIQQVLHGKPLRLSAITPDCPPELEALVERAMAKDKSERLKSAADFAEEVKAFRDGRTLQSYSYSARELAWRWVARHKGGVITAAIVFYLLIAGAMFHYAQLRQEKELVEQEKADALAARAQAEQASSDARKAEQDARRAKEQAEQKERDALKLAQEKDRALAGWDQTLADAYAMRVRLAMAQHDHNAALAFAAAAQRSAEQPEARGALLSTPRVCQLLWSFAPDKPSTQEIYQFFDVRFSPDGRLVATGMSDGRVWLWSVETGNVAQLLQLGTAAVHDVAFSPDARYLAAGNENGQVRIWEKDEASGQYAFNGMEFATTERGGRVNSVEFSPDGRSLVCGGVSVLLYDLATRELTRFEGPAGHEPMYVTFSPDGRTLLSTSIRFEDFFVRVWDVEGRKFKRGLLDQTSMNELFAAWSPDGSMFATSTLQGQIILRDAVSLKQLGMLIGHTSSVLGLAFSPDGGSLLSCSADGTMRMWDVRSREQTLSLTGFTDWIQSVSFAPDGRSICARDTTGRVLVWAVPHESSIALKGHGGDVMDVRHNPDGTRFLTAGWDGSVVLWDDQARAPIRRFSAPLVQFFAADFLGDRVVAGGSNGVYVWDAASGEQLAHLRKGDYVTDVAVEKDARRFWVVQYRSAHCYDAASFEHLFETHRHAQLAVSVRLAPDGTRVATTSQDGTIIVSSASDGKGQLSYDANAGTCYSVDFSADGKLMAGAYDDRSVQVWDLEQRKVAHTLLGHDGIVFSVRFSPDGRSLVSSSQDRTVRVWRADDFDCLAVLKGHSETVSRLSIDPDGFTLLTASQDDSVRHWPLDQLSLPRDQFHALGFAVTGLRVNEKEFAARMDAEWPKGVADHRALLTARLRRDNELRRYRQEFEARYEGYRYIDRVNAQGARVRRYLPARAKDASGRLVGPARGVVNHAAWWAAQHPDWAPGLQRAPVVTEVLEEGQAVELGLMVGDLLWSVDGKRVQDRDELKTLLDELAGRESFEVVVRRYARDAQGAPLERRDAEGDLLLNERGETEWEMSELKLAFRPGKLGMRIGDGSITDRPPR